MSLEPHDADGGRRPAQGEPGAPGIGDGWGWELVQRDWSLREREPLRLVVALRRAVAAVAARLSRLIRGALRAVGSIRMAGGGPGTPRSSAPRS